MQSRPRVRGTSIVEVGIAIILLGITALAMASSTSLIQSTNEVAGETALARRLVQRQIARFNRLARLARVGDTESDTLAGLNVVGAGVDDSFTAGQSFPNIWAPPTPPFVLTYDGTNLMNWADPNQATHSLDGVGVDLLGDTAAANGTSNRDRNAYHVYRELTPDERFYLDSREITVQVRVARFVANSVPDGAGVMGPPLYILNPNLDWVYQISVMKGAKILMRSVGVGP